MNEINKINLKPKINLILKFSGLFFYRVVMQRIFEIYFKMVLIAFIQVKSKTHYEISEIFSALFDANIRFEIWSSNHNHVQS